MTPAKSPALPFYGKDIYTDVPTLSLSFAAQGLYVRLLWWQWSEGFIPDDVKAIADIVGREREVRRLWPDVRPFFEPMNDDPRRLANRKLESIRAGMVSLREKRASAGSKGGSKPKANTQASAITNGEANSPPAVAVAVASAVPQGEKFLSSESRGGGGNGSDRRRDGFHPLWSERAFQYRCDKIPEFVEQCQVRDVIPGTDDFDTEFLAKWGISYDRWTELHALHEAYFANQRGAA